MCEIIKNFFREIMNKFDLKKGKKYVETYGIFLEGHQAAIRCAVVTKDFEFLITGSEDKTIKIWSVIDRLQVFSIEFCACPISCMALCNNSATLLFGSDDKSIRIFDLQYKKQIGILKGHKGRVTSILLTINDEFVITGSDDRSIRIWKLSTRIQEHFFLYHHDSITSLSLSGNLLISSSYDNTVKLWDLSSLYKPPLTRNFFSPVLNGVISQVHNSIFLGCYDGSIQVINFPDLKKKNQMIGHEHAVSKILLVKNSDLLISSSYDFTIRIWDVFTLSQKLVFFGHTDVILDIVEFDLKIISVGNDKSMRMWSIGEKFEDFEFDGHKARITDLKVVNNGKKAITGSFDCTVRLWDLVSKRTERVFSGHFQGIHCICTSEPSKTFASADDSLICIWTTSFSTAIQSIPHVPERITSLALVLNNKYLISCSADTLKAYRISNNFP